MINTRRTDFSTMKPRLDDLGAFAAVAHTHHAATLADHGGSRNVLMDAAIRLVDKVPV